MPTTTGSSGQVTAPTTRRRNTQGPRQVRAGAIAPALTHFSTRRRNATRLFHARRRPPAAVACRTWPGTGTESCPSESASALNEQDGWGQLSSCLATTARTRSRPGPDAGLVPPFRLARLLAERATFPAEGEGRHTPLRRLAATHRFGGPPDTLDPLRSRLLGETTSPPQEEIPRVRPPRGSSQSRSPARTTRTTTGDSLTSITSRGRLRSSTCRGGIRRCARFRRSLGGGTSGRRWPGSGWRVR